MEDRAPEKISDAIKPLAGRTGSDPTVKDWCIQRYGRNWWQFNEEKVKNRLKQWRCRPTKQVMDKVGDYMVNREGVEPGTKNKLPLGEQLGRMCKRSREEAKKATEAATLGNHLARRNALKLKRALKELDKERRRNNALETRLNELTAKMAELEEIATHALGKGTFAHEAAERHERRLGAVEVAVRDVGASILDLAVLTNHAGAITQKQEEREAEAEALARELSAQASSSYVSTLAPNGWAQ